jgi:hypothetical protein
MQYGKVTKISLREDMPASIASSAYGANLDVVGFNIRFILERKPSLAVQLLKLYSEAQKLRAEDQTAPDKDYDQANEEWVEFMRSAFDAR